MPAALEGEKGVKGKKRGKGEAHPGGESSRLDQQRHVSLVLLAVGFRNFREEKRGGRKGERKKRHARLGAALGRMSIC